MVGFAAYDGPRRDIHYILSDVTFYIIKKNPFFHLSSGSRILNHLLLLLLIIMPLNFTPVSVIKQLIKQNSSDFKRAVMFSGFLVQYLECYSKDLTDDCHEC